LTDHLALIEKYNIPITKIDTRRNYWLVRTNSGEYFEEFFLGNFVGINWNDFNDPNDFLDVNKESTTARLAETYKENKQPGHTFGQIRRFFHEMRIGDIVMIPSQDSKHIGFGEITSNVEVTQMSQTEIDEGECPYLKRRSVKWIKTVARKKLDPYLYRMMHTHLTISNANDYADAIDRTMYSFYYKGDRAHLVLNVEQQKDIPLMDLLDALQAPLDLVDFVHDPENPNIVFNKRDLDAKLRVQSPGIIELVSSGHAFTLVVIIGIAVVGLVGGKLKVNVNKEKVEGELSSEGLLEKIIKMRQQKQNTIPAKAESIEELERKLLYAQKALKMETPEVINDYLEVNPAETKDDM
jgi:hypothetical protein